MTQGTVDMNSRIELPGGMGSVVECKDGDLLLLDGRQICTSHDAGLTWGGPSPLKDAGGSEIEASGASSLLRLASGALVAVLTRAVRFAGSYDWSKDIRDDRYQGWASRIVLKAREIAGARDEYSEYDIRGFKQLWRERNADPYVMLTAYFGVV